MYESPITIIDAPMKHIMEEREKEIVLQVQMQMGVQVDRDELLRALQYDRGQYEQGYADAMASVVRCKDCKYWRDGYCDNPSGLDVGASKNAFCSNGERNGCDAGSA